MKKENDISSKLFCKIKFVVLKKVTDTGYIKSTCISPTEVLVTISC